MNRLESWKEIAEFFNVSVRTVQSWEVEKALPVHRNPGARGRVWAEETELRTWLLSQETPPPPPAGRPLLIPLILAGLVVLALVAFIVWRRPGGMPASVKTEGLSLIAFDDQGAELWRHRLPFERHALPPEVEIDYIQPTFVDLTGDGKPEVLFPLRGNDQNGETSLVLCFSHDGHLLWQFEPGRVMRTANESHPSIYLLRAIVPLRLNGELTPHLVVVSGQSPNFISQVALLDSQGRRLREYWHSGHLDFVTVNDIDANGVPEILLTGISNGFSAATLVVLDPLTMAGASREELPKFQILGQGAPVERARLLFPRTRANQIRLKYNLGYGVLLTPDQLIVKVRELAADVCGLSVNYRLSHSLELIAADLGDTSKNCYQTLFAAHLMPKLLDPQDELPELRKIKVLTPWH